MKVATVIISIGVSTLLVIGLILFACSFDVVEIGEYGLIENKNTREIEKEKTYRAGRYLLGLGKHFLTFPRSLILIEMGGSSDAQTAALNAWTNDGMDFTLEVNFYVYLNPDNLYPLYMELGPGWYAFLVRSATTAIKETTTLFTATDYFSKRLLIAQTIMKNIQATYNEVFNNSIIVNNMQIRRITFPNDLEHAIIDKLIQVQAKRTYEIKQNSTKILKQTELIGVRAANNITLINAAARANGTVITQNASAYVFKTLVDQDATSYSALKDQLGLDANSDLLQFMYTNEIPYMSRSTKFYFGISDPILDVSRQSHL
eukprot:TRINITY_DN9300_c0_g1_i10.p1 TRINITY_DN9300_c0_g1~~TRINITY_DN9300_c0_g1_i10.p1  ORF type:complete len:317 (+),score=76.39 TRINITY_DN9300_c0_g1_i10:248-1198(+)